MSSDSPLPDATSEQPTDAAPAKEKLDPAVLKIAGVVVLGSIMAILDMTVVGVAQNTFQAEWAITPATAAWTMTAYTLALAAVIPVTGWAADRFGTKRLYLTSIVLFVVGSLLCAIAWDIGPLIIFRALQGLGGGMLMPLGMTILTRAAGPDRVGRVMAVLGIPMLLGPIGGPILGGWLIDAASWHWIFLINLPIGVIGLFYAMAVLPSDAPHPGDRFDVLGFALLSPGLAAFLYGVSALPAAESVTSLEVLLPGIGGLVLIVAFVLHALKAKSALLDLRLLANRNMRFAVLTLVIFSIAFFGAMLIFPQYFIGVRGESPTMAGILGAPMGIGAMLTMPIAGALTDRFGPGGFVMGGLGLICAGMIPMSQLGPDTSYLLTSGAFFVMGLGMGMTMMPTMTAALRTLRDHQIARGSTLTNITQQVAASIGTAVVSVLLTNFLASDPVVENTSLAQLAIAHNLEPAAVGPAFDQLASVIGKPTDFLIAEGLQNAADAFGTTNLIAAVMVLFTLIPAIFLPRSRSARTDGPSTTVAMH